MDLSDLFKRHFERLNCGHRVVDPVKLTDNRRETQMVQRKNKRTDLLTARRHIKADMNPCITPLVAERPASKRNLDPTWAPSTPHVCPKNASQTLRQTPQPQQPVSKVMQRRLDRLAQWKAEKEKKKQIAKEKEKPLFKVCHVSDSIPVTDYVNAFIKGKSILTSAIRKRQFAPENGKFNPPAGVKPNLQFQYKRHLKKSASNVSGTHSLTNNHAQFGQEIPLAKRKADASEKEANQNTRDTTDKTSDSKKNSRIDKKVAQISPTDGVRSTLSDKKKLNSNKSSRKAKIGGSADAIKTPEPKENNLSIKKSDTPIKTPNNLKSEVDDFPVYVSPFVTIPRGKRESETLVNNSVNRKSTRAVSPKDPKFFTAYTSPKAGADYFMAQLNKEIDTINRMCARWQACLEDPELPEEATCSINVTVGHSRLLISKKFKQFRQLIVQCKTQQYEEKEITCEDLHGFWDMIYMQVVDLDKRFANLERMRENNWEEIVPQKEAPVRRAKTAARGAAAKKTVASSKLKDMIKAARAKKTALMNGATCEEDALVETRTPLKEQQVVDSDKRFANLERMRENNWEEIVPQKEALVRRAKTAASGAAKKTVASSKLKDMIKAARAKKTALMNGATCEEDALVETRTPLKGQQVQQVPTTASAKRTSLRVSALTTETQTKGSSPGLTMMKLTQSIKKNNGLTPFKGILKVDGCKSTGKKSDVFKDFSSPNKLRKTRLLFEDARNTSKSPCEDIAEVVVVEGKSARRSFGDETQPECMLDLDFFHLV